MPQISQIVATYASQIFWLLITFGLLYFVVGRGMVTRVVATTDARDARIAGDLAAAETARAQADRTEEAWRVEMDAARAAAQRDTAAAKAQAAQSAEAQVRSADAGLAERMNHHDLAIANAKAQALSNINAMSAEATRELVSKIAGIDVSIDEAAHAVRQVRVHG